MVHKAFREILGESATQAGSENAPGRFRFDFPATGALSSMVMDEVEGRVNEILLANVEVRAEVMSQDEAKAIGAMALFGEKYGDQVRVVSVGDWAKELCGGTHVLASGEIGLVKLLGESSIGSGVRRVDALVGADAFSYLNREHLLLSQISAALKVTQVEEIPGRISQILGELKDAEKELSSFRVLGAVAELSEKEVVPIRDFSLLTHHFTMALSADDLRQIAMATLKDQSTFIIALSSVVNGKVILVVVTGKRLIELGIKAGSLVKAASEILGGGGGGKDDFATGGGSKVDQIKSAFGVIESDIRKVLGE
jgi:alanyl-tRNA synthetase